MSLINVQASDIIPAPPEKVYAVLADYREGHPAILPRPYFSALLVKEGGQGAGTLVEVQMNVYGNRFNYLLRTSEPEPGRVLVETDEQAGVTTTFRVDPVEAGRKSWVTISTQTRQSPGMRGLLERLFNPGIMRRIYHKELEQLSAYVQPGE